ncbi:MAG: 5-oxoprolinase subunit PxpB [Bacteroidota bacterium]|nr:5-oxoprolinase subunit PxpB [Bacteroidota bacterium]
MDHPNIPYRIFPLGDTAITIDFGNVIDESINDKVLALFDQLRNDPLPGTIEVVPAYSSVTIYYDLFGASKSFSNGKSVYDTISGQLAERMEQTLPVSEAIPRLVNIPVCYEKEFAPDIEYLARERNITVDELIHIHVSRQYRVYMLGFLPGFAYMGEVNKTITIPRKPQPVTVAAGSVGIAGKQTGIYPLQSPGGWQIIGRTPLKLFDADREEPSLLRAGDRVQFISISKNEFESY